MRRSVSRKVQVSHPYTTPRLGISTTKTLRQSDIAQQRQETNRKYDQHKAAMAGESRQALNELSGEPYDDDPIPEMDISGNDQMEWEEIPPHLKEDETFVYALRDYFGSRWRKRQYKDQRTWKQRIRRVQENWAPLIDTLIQAFLLWKYPMDNPSFGSNATPDQGNYDFVIDVVDIYTLRTSCSIPRTAAETTAYALVRSGYIGNTPEQPSLATSIETLELFRKLRLRKPSFSVEAFSKVVCDCYKIPYRRRYRTSLSNSFDVYLSILRVVEKHISKALGRDIENWRVLNACPPCSYELEGEIPLKFSRMLVLDGNNSLKRLSQLGSHAAIDKSAFQDSDYFLPTSFVNSFSDEVPSRESISEETDDANTDTSPEDSTDSESPCWLNWKAAAADEKKRMWGIFDETGIFACACRHGLVLWLADMVRSGELSKYPLAIVAMALKVLPPHLLIAYDIGCGFGKTIESSSLGALFKALGHRMCVNAFHGYSHNFECQVQHHPNIIEGMGIEDLETLERIFSSSNQLAPVTRYATAFRRRVFIDLFFNQWDADKYQNLATMLLDNYLQALDIINNESIPLSEAMTSLNIQDSDIARWHKEQVQYFSTLGKEPEWDIHAVAYVELLQKLQETQTRYQDTNTRFLNATPADYHFSSKRNQTYASDTSQTQKVETNRRYLMEQRDTFLQEVLAMEVKMGIAVRWTPASREFQDTLKYTSKRKYHRALDELQRLVVMRLFELHKLNLNQTAYRVRTHMAKSLQTRCKAIRNAVKRYNEAAAALNPPRPPLDWSQVSHYNFLDDFELLQDTRDDVRARPWAQPAIREAIKQYHRINRAREEIVRLNVEIRRLYTSIIDEHHHFDAVLSQLQSAHDVMIGPVQDFVDRRRAVNNVLLAQIFRIFDAEWYTGEKTVGVRKGGIRIHHSTPMVSAPVAESAELENEEEIEAAGEVGDEEEDDMGRVFDYMADVSLITR